MADDSFHQSAYGHANIAMRVMDIVDRVGVPKSSRIGTFHDKDHCDNWLQSGVIGDSLTYGDTFKILKMPNTEKYTLELTEGDSGWVKINNQADHPMRLYIGYMTTSPAPFVYPVMEARLEQTDLRVILEPSTIGYEENQKVHVPRLGDMGMVDPGEATIFFEVVEKAERPFRLVQTILTVDKPGRENLESGRWMEKTS